MVSKGSIPDSELVLVINPVLKIVGQKMRFSPNMRCAFLNFLSEMLLRVEVKEDILDLVSGLCSIATESVGGWTVRDSALSCISNMMVKTDISSGEIQLILNTIRLCRRQCDEVFVKSAAIRTLTAVMEHLSDKLADKQLSEMFPFDCTNELEKREAVKLAAKMVEKLPDHIEIQKKLCGYIVTLLNKESDWEVKVNTAKFWSSLVEGFRTRTECREDFMKKLEELQVLTGLVLGLRDYEKSVRLAYYKVIHSMNFDKLTGRCPTTNDTVKRKATENTSSDIPVPPKIARKSSEVQDDCSLSRNENIEDILDESDRSLVLDCCSNKNVKNTSGNIENFLNYKEVVTFEEFQEVLSSCSREADMKESSPEEELESVLDDIIQSSTDQCQIDLVDCY